MKMKSCLMIGAFVLVLVLFGVQVRSISRLQSEVGALRQQMSDLETGLPEVTSPDRSAPRLLSRPANNNAALRGRLAELELAVARLGQATDQLMERGLLPLSTNKLIEFQRRFFDLAASDRDRLVALRQLRRNRGVTDDVVQYAASWLQSATNAGTRRELLQQLEGFTNAVLKAPLMNLLASESSGRVREQAVDNLGRFVNDPQVEQRLWDVLRNDPNGEVREEAADALQDGPFTETRLAALRQRAVSPDASLEEKIVALRAMRRSDVDAPEVTATLVDLAQNTQDPQVRARLFSAFDGLDDPVLKAPLVYGLQDPNPVVREEAADALSAFASDPAVQQWLKHIIETDADPRVRREALRALDPGD